MKHTKTNIIIREPDEDDEDMEVTQTEEAVKDNQPIKKGFGALIQGKNDHGYICPQYKSTCKYLSQPKSKEQHWLITRAKKFMLHSVQNENLSFAEKR